MKRLDVLALMAVVPALVLVACPGKERTSAPAARTSAPPGNRWNVVLLTIDTLRADHMGTYGYGRDTSPRMDAIGRAGTVFERAYTFWPKTRGSFVALLTGRTPSRSGYSKTHPVLLDFNATLASVLAEAGYRTAAVVDNPNVAARLGYAKGFETYRETWEEKALETEVARAQAITEDGIRFLQQSAPDRPFFLWLHYVNPHAPYTPPPPYDTAFVGGRDTSARLAVVPGFHGGIPKQWAVPGRDRLGYYVAQYDGEIAAVDQEVGRVWDALEAAGLRSRTVFVLTSDHGESLGEHGYFFDHGENVFDPSLEVPLLVVVPEGAAGARSAALASTLDVVPTVLDAVKVSYPPDLAGRSLLSAVAGRAAPARDRLFAQNDRNLVAGWDARYKIVATPGSAGHAYALFDRERDPGETRDASAAQPDALRSQRRELELYLERTDGEWARTRRLVEGKAGEGPMSPEACEKLKAMGYIQQGCS
jgi:arylsulfatase A-like enzyme